MLEAGEVELNSGCAPEVDQICWSLLSLYADHQVDIIPRLFATGAIIRYPHSGIVIAGSDAVERWYTAGFRLAPTMVLDHVYADHGALWTLSKVSFGVIRADQTPAGVQVAKLTLRGDRIARMDVYLLGDRWPVAPVTVPRTGAVRSGARRGQLRSLLLFVGILTIVGSVMAAFVPATDPSTGVNVTVGFGLFNVVALTAGLILVLLGAKQRLTPRSEHPQAVGHRHIADRRGLPEE